MPKEEDTSKRAKKIGSDRYEKSEKRKESRKKWQQSEAGKKSMHDRGERYRQMIHFYLVFFAPGGHPI